MRLQVRARRDGAVDKEGGQKVGDDLGLNVVLAWIPLRTVPIFVNLTAADVAGSTPWGTIGVLTVGWGDSLKNGFVMN